MESIVGSPFLRAGTEGIPLFQGLLPDDLSVFQRVTTSRIFSGHTQIMNCSNDSGVVYIILSGAVRVRVQRGNRGELILNILGPGELLGEINAVDGLGHSADVVTSETTNLLAIDRKIFIDLLKKMPLLSFNLVSILTRRLRRLTDHAEALATLDLHGRLAHQLIAFAEDYGQNTPDKGILIPMGLTQTDLASLVGASRERVNRTMAFFKQQDYISTKADGRIVIRDLQALRKRCR